MNSLSQYNATIDYPEEDYYSTITTSEAYNKGLEILNDNESITTHYNNSLKNRISQALLLTFELTDNQLRALLSFILAIAKIEQECNCELRDIDLTPSVENEIVFFRKSQLGVSILSIDSDGDLLLNFTGFKTGFETDRYIFGEEIDFEKLIYNFLSR